MILVLLWQPLWTLVLLKSDCIDSSKYFLFQPVHDERSIILLIATHLPPEHCTCWWFCTVFVQYMEYGENTIKYFTTFSTKRNILVTLQFWKQTLPIMYHCHDLNLGYCISHWGFIAESEQILTNIVFCDYIPSVSFKRTSQLEKQLVYSNYQFHLIYFEAVKSCNWI